MAIIRPCIRCIGVRMSVTELHLLDLLHIGSPALPVGAYAFSNGLESAMNCGWLNTEDDLHEWLSTQLRFGLGRLDVPVLQRLQLCLQTDDLEKFNYWNQFLLASRESAELQLADTATGLALLRLLPQIGVSFPLMAAPASYAAALTHYAVAHQLPPEQSALVYCWSWLENQISAATKLLPLGQTRAQVMLFALRRQIPAIVEQALTLGDDDIGFSLPALALAGMAHETQYTRLFRS